MMDALIFAAVLGSGLVAGIFFAFSTFVMRALGQLPKNQGIAAMKAINVTVLNPWFFLAFFGTAAVCVPVAFLAFGNAGGTNRAYLLAGCALYLFGCVLVTMVFNVPLNNRLAAAEPESPAGPSEDQSRSSAQLPKADAQRGITQQPRLFADLASITGAPCETVLVVGQIQRTSDRPSTSNCKHVTTSR